jgi:hypothetical protein
MRGKVQNKFQFTRTFGILPVLVTMFSKSRQSQLKCIHQCFPLKSLVFSIGKRAGNTAIHTMLIHDKNTQPVATCDHFLTCH